MESFPKMLSDVVQWEVNQNYTREEVTFTSGSKYKLGDIIDVKNGKAALVSSTITAPGIVVSDEVDATEADAKGVVISEGPAIVLKSVLNYNSVAEATVDAALKAKGIKVVKAAG